MRLNGYGQVAHDEWYRSADIRAELALDAFVVMPNHVHGIVFIDGQEGDPPVAPTLINGPRPRSLGSFIAGYKSSVTRRIGRAQTDVGATGGSPSLGKPRTVWQRNYHDHIVRNGIGLSKIRRYIQDNPREWETDDHYVPGDGRKITTNRCTRPRDLGA